MKKLYFLLLLVSGFINAQIVNIPDANLKSKLIMANPIYQIAKDQLGNNIAIDTNLDGQIEVSEALTVYELNLSIFGAPFTDMTGILSFSNLKTLSIASNHITNLNLAGLDLENLSCDFCYITLLDLTPFPHLKHLTCGSNSISSLNLSTVPLLETLNCRYNNLASLDLQYVPNLNDLNCQNNQIASLNLSATPNLNSLLCDGNHLTSIDLNNVVNLQTLGCGGNQITTLNLSNVPSMEDLSFSYCSVSSVDLSLMPNLRSLICPFNQISSLDLSHSPNLINLWCYNNLLTSLDVDSNLNLEQLQCEDNQITNIVFNNPHPQVAYLNFSNNLMTGFNFNNAVNSQGIVCSNNQLTTIDFSSMLGLNGFDCSGNNLTFLSIKNGRVESDVNFSNNPNLSFICVDDSQVVSIQNLLNNLGMTTTVSNSYCSFVPGENHNTITGEVVFDGNNNGCDSNDSRFPLIKFKLYDQYSYLGATATNSLGMYTFFPPYYDISISPDVENQEWFNFSPPNANFQFVNINNTSIQNFCITTNGVHPDLEIVIVPITPPRPGFTAQYQIVYKNKGNQVISGDITLNYDDNLIDFINASVQTSSQNTGSIQWTFSNLYPFQDRSIIVTFYVNPPTAIPPVSIGTLLHFSAVINPVSADETPYDNSAE